MDIFAHRGNHDDELAPENTLEAFENAWNLSINGVELDIRLTADNQVVVFHDNDTGHLADQRVAISKCTLQNLKDIPIYDRYRRLNKQFTIPSLKDVLDKAPANKKIYIELKCGREIIDPLLDIFKSRQKILKQVIFIGFSNIPMKRVSEAFPDNETYLIYRKKDAPHPEPIIREALKCNVAGVDIQSCEYITNNFVNTIKEQGLSVHTYLVNNYEKKPDLILQILKSGVNSITTNRPKWLTKIIEERKIS